MSRSKKKLQLSCCLFGGIWFALYSTEVAGQEYAWRVQNLPEFSLQIQNEKQKLDHATVFNVGTVGDESANIISDDPNSVEAQLAETTGKARFCGRTVGTLNLFSYNERYYLIGNSHSFYENGFLRCDDGHGTFHPDLHYDEKTSGIDRKRGFAFKLPPLNHDDALKEIRFKTDRINLNDLIVLEIMDNRVLKRQTGGPRKVVQMADIDHETLPEVGNLVEVFIMSTRQNFGNGTKTTYENGCLINNYHKNSLKKHSCDTGKGASGSSLNFTDGSGNIYSVGIHYAGTQYSTIEDFYDDTSDKGNFFIPSSHILEVLKKYTE